MAANQNVRTRFAPSPTGFLHVGGVRTALFAWLVSKQAGGEFILRIEDTDKVREVSGSEQHIIDSLSWLGLAWSEGPDKGGVHGPYRQSERLTIYKEWAQKLVDSGRAYADPTTSEDLEKLRAAAKDQKRPFLFREHRPESPQVWDGSQPLRFKSEPKAYKWHDEVMGELSAGPETVDDFIIIKSDGYPTYNFAHIIDDYLMEISHVIRSQEFVSSVPKFLNLYEALEIKQPKLATLPYVMGPDGNKKLSKRDGAKDILDYKKEGYLADALINLLATLGWNDGTEQEIFSMEDLIQKFSLVRVQKSGARFDERRLLWMNGHYIRELSLEELSAIAEPFWEKRADKTYQQQVLALVQERLKYLSELPKLTGFFFDEPLPEKVIALFNAPPDKQLRKLDKNLFAGFLSKTAEALRDNNFTHDDIARQLNGLLEELETKPGILFAIIRIAVTGEASSPEIFGTLQALGKEKTLQRLARAIESLEN